MKSWISAAIGSALFAALLALFTKQCFGQCSNIDTILVTAIITIAMAGFLLFVATLRGKNPLKALSDPTAISFMILSGIAGALSWHCLFSAYNSAPTEYTAAITAIDRLSVIFVLLFNMVFFGDKFNAKTALGATLCALGAILFMYK